MAGGASQPLPGGNAGMAAKFTGEKRMWDGEGQPLVLMPAPSALSMGVKRGWARCRPPHVGTHMGFAFSPMRCGIRPHGPAPAWAHLGSLCVEWGCKTCQVGAGAMASVLDLPQVGQGELRLPQCLADSHDGVRF